MIFFVVVSCLDDKNDYDYKTINAKKRIEGLQGSYSLFEGEKLILKPKFVPTIDSINPDLSYAWYYENKLVSTADTFEFVANKVGSFPLTYTPIDNKTGMGFPEEITVYVNPRYAIGWFILSEKSDGASKLSVIETRKIKDPNTKIEELIYYGAHVDIYPNLGKGPKRIVEHFINDDYGPVVKSELTIVQSDKMLDLNGNTLEREVYTEQEFESGAPAGFSPIDAFQTYTSGYILDADGSIYFKLNWIQDAFHTGTYSNTPLLNGGKFSAIYGAKTSKTKHILAIEKGTDQIIGLVEVNQNPLYHGHRYNGKKAKIVVDEKDKELYDVSYFTGRKVLGIGWHNDSRFLELGQERNGKYFLHNFELKLSDYQEDGNDVPIEVATLTVASQAYKNVFPNGELDKFVDMVVLPYRDYAIFASGSTLYYYEYTLDNAKSGDFKTFSSPIVSIAYKDFKDSETYGGAHLGVALEDGRFYILRINDDNIKNSEEIFQASGFGKVIDVVYKMNSLMGFDYGYF